MWILGLFLETSEPTLYFQYGYLIFIVGSLALNLFN